MDVVARPLTQPSRFLSLAGIGLSISAALTFDYIRQRWRWRMAGPVLTVLCLDSFVWGGLSLELPRTQYLQGVWPIGEGTQGVGGHVAGRCQSI